MIKTGADNLSAYIQMQFKKNKHMTVHGRVLQAAVAAAQLTGSPTGIAAKAPYRAVEKQVKSGIRQKQ